MRTAEVPSFPALAKDCEADVCVVGAGIAGLSTAYELAVRGRSVVVLDDGAIGGGETQRTSAHLSNAIDDGYAKIESLHGRSAARLAAESHTEAIDRIEAIAAAERIECGFERVDGFLCLAEGDPRHRLEDELAAARRAGVEVEPLEHSALRGLGPCLRFPRQAQFHPLRYLVGLAEAAHRWGAQVHADSRVVSIEPGERVALRTDAGMRVSAQDVVVATNTPIHERVAIHTKQAAYRTYVIALRGRADALPKALYWDTADPYHYVRGAVDDAGAHFVLVGGEDHRVGGLERDEAERRYAELEDWARLHVPGLGEVADRWSGEVMEPVDALAFIGLSPGAAHVYLATGDSGMGLTHGAAAGMLLSALITDGAHPWRDLYDPSRKTLGSALTWLGENFLTLVGYSEWLQPGADCVSIPADGGAVVRRGLKPLAVHRDRRGDLHVRSALCPHLGGLVAWNDAEKTWDCPCHGSRFDRFGRVVHGPANEDLGDGR